VKRFILLIAAVVLSGCDSSIVGVQSYASPDGRHVVLVVTELQAANDPTPWWQHVSLRKPGSSPSIRGSIATFEGRGSLDVTWSSPTEVRVVVPQELLRTSKLPPTVTRDGVTIHFQTATPPGAANTPNQATQLTASKPAVCPWSVCRRNRTLRSMHRGLAAAVDSFAPAHSHFVVPVYVAPLPAGSVLVCR
jgi:hypothetical protein